MGKERTDADEEVGDNYRPTLTKSELKFFERQRKREMDRILLKVKFWLVFPQKFLETYGHF